jgi:hypothetical protein
MHHSVPSSLLPAVLYPLIVGAAFEPRFVIPESAAGGYPWFDRPFDRLTVLSKVEGLTVLNKVEGHTVLSIAEGLTTLSEVEGESR